MHVIHNANPLKFSALYTPSRCATACDDKKLTNAFISGNGNNCELYVRNAVLRLQIDAFVIWIRLASLDISPIWTPIIAAEVTKL
jgi:hypothetical protein